MVTIYNQMLKLCKKMQTKRKYFCLLKFFFILFIILINFNYEASIMPNILIIMRNILVNYINILSKLEKRFI